MNWGDILGKDFEDFQKKLNDYFDKKDKEKEEKRNDQRRK